MSRDRKRGKTEVKVKTHPHLSYTTYRPDQSQSHRPGQSLLPPPPPPPPEHTHTHALPTDISSIQVFYFLVNSTSFLPNPLTIFYLMINAFVMHWVPLWLYMCETQSARHYNNTWPKNALHVLLCPSSSPESTHTISPPPPPPPPSNHTKTTHQSASEDVSSKIKIKSSAASNACERVRVVQSGQK